MQLLAAPVWSEGCLTPGCSVFLVFCDLLQKTTTPQTMQPQLFFMQKPCSVQCREDCSKASLDWPLSKIAFILKFILKHAIFSCKHSKGLQHQTRCFQNRHLTWWFSKAPLKWEHPHTRIERLCAMCNSFKHMHWWFLFCENTTAHGHLVGERSTEEALLWPKAVSWVIETCQQRLPIAREACGAIAQHQRQLPSLRVACIQNWG